MTNTTNTYNRAHVAVTEDVLTGSPRCPVLNVYCEAFGRVLVDFTGTEGQCVEVLNKTFGKGGWLAC